MVIQNQEVDYNLEKARIDAHGFDAIRAMHGLTCDICGKPIDDDEISEEINGITVCEDCLQESEG